MTQQFYAGQDVEAEMFGAWRRAKILYPGGDKYVGEWWYVQFSDGSRGCFGAAYIVAAQTDPLKGASRCVD